MKNQITSILLCALLGSTLCHEYRSARHFSQAARSSKLVSNFQTRDASPQQCAWTCPRSNSSISVGLHLIVNETAGLVGVVNVTANVLLVIDIKANLVGLFDGNSGTVIVVNIQTGSGVYIAAGQSTTSSGNVEDRFLTLISLQLIIDSKEGTPFKASSISSVISEAIGNLLMSLSSQWKLDLQGNMKASLTILLEISSSLVAVLTGSLKGILNLVGKTLIALHGDILWLLNVLQGLELILREVPGGLGALIKARVELDLAMLLSLDNGIDLLVNLLLAIVARLDLAIVGDVLNSLDKLLAVLTKLSGGISEGLSGLLKVVAEIVALIGGQLKLDVLIKTLLEFAASDKSDINILIHVEGLAKVLDLQATLHSAESLKGCKAIHDSLVNGTLVVGKVNISEIAGLLAKSAVNGALQLVVNILLRLSPVVQVVEAISSLIISLLELLTSAAGVQLLLRLIPDLSNVININGNGNILVELLKQVNIPKLLSQLALTGSIEAALKAVPVFKAILDAVSGAVSACSNGSHSISVIVKSGSLGEKIIDLIKSVLSIGGTAGTSGSAGGTSGGSTSGSSEGSTGGSSGGSTGGSSGGSTGGSSGGSTGTGWSWGGSIGGSSGGSTGGSSGGSTGESSGRSTGGSSGGSTGTGWSWGGSIGGSSEGSSEGPSSGITGGSIGGSSGGSIGGSFGGSLSESANESSNSTSESEHLDIDEKHKTRHGAQHSQDKSGHTHGHGGTPEGRKHHKQY